MAVTPFRIAVPDAELDDAARRARPHPLARPGRRTRAGTTAPSSDTCRSWWATGPTASTGAPASRCSTPLPQYRTEVDAPGFEGFGLHFVHQPGVGPAPLPLVLAHGWPSTHFEYHDVVARLANPGAFGDDPADAFHVVVPSLPGYGFSDIPRRRGMTPRVMATMFVALMRELGYDRFAAAGLRLGRVRDRAARPRPPRRARRHPHGDAQLPRARPYEPTAEDADVQRPGEGLAARGVGLQHHPGHQAAVARVRAHGLAGRRSRRGSSRSGDAGPTARATSSGCSRATSCSPPSPSTGSPARSTAPIASTTRAATTRSGSTEGERVQPPAGFLLERVVEGTDPQHRPAAPEPGRCGLRRAPLDGGRPGPPLPRHGEPRTSTSRSCGRSSGPCADGHGSVGATPSRRI